MRTENEKRIGKRCPRRARNSLGILEENFFSVH
jgi:hypothetical protein